MGGRGGEGGAREGRARKGRAREGRGQANAGHAEAGSGDATLCSVPMQGHTTNATWERLRHEQLRLALIDTHVVASAPTTLGMDGSQFARLLQRGAFDARVHFPHHASVLHATWNREQPRSWLKEGYFKSVGAWCVARGNGTGGSGSRASSAFERWLAGLSRARG